MESRFEELLTISQFAYLLISQLPLAIIVIPFRYKQQKLLIGQVICTAAQSEFL